jgi:hypothetical protein
MTDSPVDTKIERISVPGQTEFIRIEAKDGLRIMARLDMSLTDFAALILGQEITAAFSQPGKT